MLKRLWIYLFAFLFVFCQECFADIDCQSQSYIPQIECEALVAIYNSTNGSGWTNSTGWLTESNPLNWYGVESLGSDKIMMLSLANNNLNGPIPPEIGNFSNLGEINFDSNQLNGSIPPEIGNLSKLSGLYLSSNQLNGSIPSEIGNLSALRFLFLNSNLLSGSIPPEIGNLSNMGSLDLDSNQLSGSIPPEVGNLVNMTGLKLGSNQLSGSIPAEIGNLSSLLALYLESNLLSGPIPPEIGNLTNIKTLSLHSNQLSGPIPSEIGNLSKLVHLHLRLNYLTGPVPISVAQLGASLYYTKCSFTPYDLFGENAVCLPNIVEYQFNGTDYYCGLLFSNECIVQGDFNGDGILNLKDIIFGLRILTGNTEDYIFIFSDVDDDEKIGINDILNALNDIINQ